MDKYSADADSASFSGADLCADDIVTAKRMMINMGIIESDFISMFKDLADSYSRLKSARKPVELTVWEGKIPESNGKSNFSAMLMRKGGDRTAEGISISCSEYPDRVRYEADCLRYLIGELDEEPCVLDYDSEKHSGYEPSVAPVETPRREVSNRVRKWDGTVISADTFVSLLLDYSKRMPVNGIAQWAFGAAAKHIAGGGESSSRKKSSNPIAKQDQESCADLITALRRDAAGEHSATVFQLDQAANLLESSVLVAPEKHQFIAASPEKILDDSIRKFLTECASTRGSMISGDHLAHQAKRLLDAASNRG